MKRLYILFFFLSGLLMSMKLHAQTVSLVKNINASANNYGSDPQNIVALGSSVVFNAYEPLTGRELWISNGATTTLLKDINPGGNGSDPAALVKIGSYVYFQANDGVNGNELWRTDGTAAGTILVKDINAGPDSSYPYSFVQFSNPSAGLIYFTAYDATNGYELWKTDGTSGGTVLVADINTGSNDSNPQYLTAIGSSFLVFSAYTPAKGQEFYSYNGSSYGVADINSNNGGADGSYPSSIVSNGSKAFFQAYNPTYGYELWISDGTTTITSGTGLGTYIVDINGGTASSYPSYITAVPSTSTVFFQAYTPTSGYELFKSTGGLTATNLELVATTGSSSPYNLVPSGSGIFFIGYDAINGYTLKYITTAAATATVISGTTSSIDYVTSYGSGQIFFRMYNATYGYELWKATTTTATLIKDIVVGANSSYPSYLTFTGVLFFSADDGVNGYELWSSDGTSLNTQMASNINGAADSNASITNTTSSGFLMSAYDGVNGQELWKTDVTTVGTTLVADIATGTDYSSPYFLGQIGSNYFFNAYRSDVGNELWRTNGTSGATLFDIVPGTDYSYPYYGAVLSNKLYFYAYHPTYGYELWVTDGTAAPTVVKDIYPGTNSSYPSLITVMGSNIYFVANDGTNGNELWKSDGTLAGTVMVKDISLSGSSSPNRLTVVGNTLYFRANDGVNGNELWKSDGTSLGTVAVKDINSTGSSNPNNLVGMGSTLFFTANDGINGIELWKSDGTSGGTVMVKDIESTTATASSSPSYLTVGGSSNNLLFFSAYTATNGVELWKTDGTTAGTVIVKDIRPGTANSYPTNIKSINGTVYFYGTDGASGNLLYKSNGTSSGTIKATSAGLAYDGPGIPYYYNNKIIFTGNTSTYGNEPLTIMAEPLNQPTALNFTGRTATSITASFTAAAGSPSGYIVIRKAGSASTDLPVDGAAYAVGATIGTSTVAAIGSSTSFTDSGLTGATTYYYSIYSYNNDGVVNIYKPWSPLSGNSTTFAALPAAQPTAFTESVATTTSFIVSFTAATGTPSGYLVLRKSGTTAPTDVPVAGTSYTAGGTIGSSTVAYVGAAVTFPQSGFAADQSFSYAIFSFNGSGSNINYLTTAPLTGTAVTITTEPTAQPTALNFSSIAATTLTGSFTASVPAAGGYLVVRSLADNLDANAPVDGVSYASGNTIGANTVVFSGSTTSFNDTGLTSSTKYYYAVYSFNGTGGAVNYLTSSPLKNSVTTQASDITPPVVANTSVSSIATGSSISKLTVTVTDPESTVSTVSAQVRSISGGSAFTTLPMTAGANNTWESASITANQIGDTGIEFKIVATNSLNLTTTSDLFKVLVTYPAQSLSINYSSPGIAQTNYRIISVPLNLNSKSVSSVFDELGTADNAKWRLFRWDGSKNTELGLSSQIELGKGYWFISKDAVNLKVGDGSAASVSFDQPFSIDLTAGWNQIGNPYLYNVLWSDVTTASGNTALKLRTFNGNFNDGTTLNKFEGGFVNAGQAMKLVFPTTKNTGARTALPSPMMNTIDKSEWEVNFTLHNGDITNIFGGVGMNASAVEGYDQFDDFTLPRFMDFLELNHDKTFVNSAFTKDIVATTENKVWHFTVDSNLTGITEIKWNNSYFGKNEKSIVLWDVEQQRAIDMREASSYSFNQESSKAFEVYYGDKEFVKGKTELNTLIIHTVSPNPAAGIVKVEFSVPGSDKTNVQVNVKNVLGQSVSHVFGGMLESGYYQMEWNGMDDRGTRPAEGLYLMEIKTEKYSSVKRLVLK